MPQKRKTILVVDDDERVLLALEQLLENEGYDTSLAWTGREGLIQLHRQHFDLVLLDCYLAGFDGREVLKAAQDAAEPPIVMVLNTGGEPCAIARRYMEGGALGFVNKRGSEPEILLAIDACFAHPHLAASDPAANFHWQGR